MKIKDHAWLCEKINREMGLEFCILGIVEFSMLKVFKKIKKYIILTNDNVYDGLNHIQAYEIIAAAFELEQAENLVIKKQAKLKKKLEEV